MNRSALLVSIDNVLIEMFPSYLAACEDVVYWLPFSPRIERIHSLLSGYYALVLFESICILLSIVCVFPLIVFFCRHQIVHSNLIIMLILNGTVHLISVVLRQIQILYEIGWMPIRYPGCFPIPQIVIVRLTHYISIILLMGGIVVERAFATHYVIDYEQKKRRWIAALICLILFALSLFIASQIVQGAINGIFFAAAMVAPVCLSLIAFRLLLRRNVKRLATLNQILERRFAQDQYSLSLRLQLCENIWTMQKLNHMASIASPLCLLCLPFIVLPPFLLKQKDSWWILELITESNNVVLAAIAPFIAIAIVAIFEEVRRMFLPKSWQTERRKFGRVIVDSSLKSSESDQHFDQLRQIFDKPH